MPSILERRIRAISKSLELSYDQWYLITKANWLCTQIAISALPFDRGVTASKILLIDDDRDIISVRTVAHRLSSARSISRRFYIPAKFNLSYTPIGPESFRI